MAETSIANQNSLKGLSSKFGGRTPGMTLNNFDNIVNVSQLIFSPLNSSSTFPGQFLQAIPS